MMPTAILFDWDNTLVDGWAAIAAALNAVFARHAMPPWTAAQAQAQVRGSLRDTFPAMFGTGWQQDAELFYATLADQHLQHLRLMPGALALLDACAGVPLAVVSNKQGAILRREVAHLGWTARFGAIVGAGDAVADKPDPAPVHMALAGLGLRAGADVWFVGDTVLDMATARAAGCHAVLVGSADHDGGLAQARPDQHATGAAELALEVSALAR